MNPLGRRRKGARCATLLLAACIVGASAAPNALAGPADLPGDKLTLDEKRKVRRALGMLESAWKDCLGNTLDEQFNPDSQNGQASQVCYEDGDTTTLKDALRKLRSMLDQNRIRKEDLGTGGYGYTRPRSGTDDDVIVVNSRDLAKICDATMDDDVRAAAKICLAATLANELTHVFQKFAGVDLEQCDAERDSDCSHLKFFDAVIASLEDDMGDPHDNINDIGNDGDAGPALKKCLDEMNAEDAAEIEAVRDSIKAQRDADKERKETVFEDNIETGTSWGKAYYGSTWTTPIRFPDASDPAMDRAVMDSTDGSTTRTFLVPAGNTLVESTVFTNKDGQLCLAIVSTDPLGNLTLQIFCDADGDGLPENPAVATIPFPVQIPAPQPFAMHDVFILPTLAASINAGGVPCGMMFIDTIRGELLTLDLNADGTPSGAIQPLLLDPLLADPSIPGGGGYFYMNSYFEWPSIGDVRLALSCVPDVMHFPHVPAIAIDVPLGGPPVLTDGLTLGEAASPDWIPGTPQLLPFAPELVLMGNPFSLLEVRSIGQGFDLPLGAGNVLPPDPQVLVPLAQPLIPPDLILVNDELREQIYMLPPIGANIDCALLDENGDSFPDRIHLVQDPARLHFFAGVPSLPPDSPVKQHSYEQVIEDPAVRGIERFEPGIHLLEGEEIDIELLPLQLVGSDPVYVQSFHDFDNDGAEDDAAVLLRIAGSADFEVTVLINASGPPWIPLPCLTIPPFYEPDRIFYEHLNADPFLDMRITSATGEPDVCLLNKGGGFLVQGPCFEPGCPGDVTTTGGGAPGVPDGTTDLADLLYFINIWTADLGMPTPNPGTIADVTTTGTAPGDPGFGQPDGNVDLADLLFYVNEWTTGLTVCP